MTTDLSSYCGYRFQPEIISYSVWRWCAETAVLQREEACSDHRGHRIRLSESVHEIGSSPPSVLIAMCYQGLGRNEEAIEWLQRGVDERDGLCPTLRLWTPFDPLRSDPRFQALLQRMNFPPQA